MNDVAGPGRLSVGSVVDDFSVDSTAGPWQLSQQSRAWLVIYFYPRDNTPGCTTESEEFRDALPAFTACNAEVLGVSRDTLKSHINFQEKYQLPFVLLSDPNEVLCSLFGVMKQKNMYGKQVRGIERSTFILDINRRIVQEWRGVKVPEHVGEVLQSLQLLAAR